RTTRAEGPRRARVEMLTGCIQAVVFGAHTRATARVLARNGCDVLVPEGQRCCGALNAHGGDHARALAMARQTIDAFEAVAADFVIVNTSGCGAHMKAYGHLLADDPAYAERAKRFAATVRDLAEFLAQEPLRGPLQPVTMTCTYHDPCHVVHGQKIKSEPRRLLAQIPGLRLVELPESDWCCGSAGIYNLTQPEMATRLALDLLAVHHVTRVVVGAGHGHRLERTAQGLLREKLREVAHRRREALRALGVRRVVREQVPVRLHVGAAARDVHDHEVGGDR